MDIRRGVVLPTVDPHVDLQTPARPSLNCNPEIHRRDIGLAFGSFVATQCVVQSSVGASETLRSPLPSLLSGQQTDLIFPEQFQGTWIVTSVLQKVDLPFGESQVPDIVQVRRAQNDDLDKPKQYQVRFVTLENGWTVMDRKYNTASLLETYTGMDMGEAMSRIQWNPAKPDHMSVSLPRGLRITSDINQRSQSMLSKDLLETSEFYQQFIDDSQQVKLKASTAYTKWRWREDSTSNAPSEDSVQIVATQSIADFPDPNDPRVSLQSLGKPVVVYTYRLSLKRLINI